MLKELLNKEMEIRMVDALRLNMFLKDHISTTPINSFNEINNDITIKGEDIGIKFSNPLFLNMVYNYMPLYKIRKILKNDKVKTEITLSLCSNNISVAGLGLLKELLDITFNKSIASVICIIENLLTYYKNEKINDNKVNELYRVLDLNVYVFKAKYPQLVNKFLSTIGFIKLNENGELENNDYLKIVEAILDVMEQYNGLLRIILTIIAEFDKPTYSNRNLEPESVIRK